MRIFKNRGDIFFSKTNKEKSTEQKILISALVFIVSFTIVFVTAFAIKYDFSAKKFFKPESLQTTSADSINNEISLPEVSGKNNFVVMVSDKNRLLFVYLLQVDMDSVSYKLTTLKPDTIADGKGLDEIFVSGDAENTKLACESLIGTDFDYYISFERDKFIEIFNDFGNIKYPMLEEIKYKNNTSAVPYSVKIKDGEQNLSGNDVVNLVRYYLENDKQSFANDLLLTCLVQQVNSDNLEKSDTLFRNFIKSVDTNISVKNYSLCTDSLLVLSNERTGVSIYNAPAQYKADKITDESLREVKGYFSK